MMFSESPRRNIINLLRSFYFLERRRGVFRNLDQLSRALSLLTDSLINLSYLKVLSLFHQFSIWLGFDCFQASRQIITLITINTKQSRGNLSAIIFPSFLYKQLFGVKDAPFYLEQEEPFDTWSRYPKKKHIQAIHEVPIGN